MLTPAARRWSAVLASLAALALACARAELPITPAAPKLSTPVVVALRAATTAASATSAPTEAATATEAAATAPAATTDAGTPTTAPTSVVPLTPTFTPVSSPTTAATATPKPSATTAATATLKAAPATLPPSVTAPAAATATATSNAGVVPAPQPIPSSAKFIQTFTATNDGGLVYGQASNLNDKQEITWVSLRGGNAAWVLTLKSAQNIAGVRLYGQSDNGDPSTLTQIAISPDGNTWATVYQGQGNCGVPHCDTLALRQYTDIGFGTYKALAVRITGGPTNFALGEVLIAAVP